MRLELTRRGDYAVRAMLALAFLDVIDTFDEARRAHRERLGRSTLGSLARYQTHAAE